MFASKRPHPEDTDFQDRGSQPSHNLLGTCLHSHINPSAWPVVAAQANDEQHCGRLDVAARGWDGANAEQHQAPTFHACIIMLVHAAKLHAGSCV